MVRYIDSPGYAVVLLEAPNAALVPDVDKLSAGIADAFRDDQAEARRLEGAPRHFLSLHDINWLAPGSGAGRDGQMPGWPA